jgi:hypothetical protein
MDFFYIIIAVVVGIVLFSKYRRWYKRKKVEELIEAYPPFGGCRVKLYNKRYINSSALGYFSRGRRVIVVCMHNSLEEIMDTYLHERRHSEQAFGGNKELNVMYENSVGFNMWLEDYIGKPIDFDDYWNLEHEIDAREWASKTLKEYLANN